MTKTKNDDEYLNNLRHSAAHLLAAAVMELYPKAKRTIGPAIENGFYFDFDDLKISEDDLSKIEKKMREILPSWKNFKRGEVDFQQARMTFKDNPYKIELIEEFAGQGSTLSLYRSGNYEDLCRGGHVEKPNEELKYFKLLKIAGAYWRGSEKNKMLTRVYGTCFPTKEELDAHVKSLQEAVLRDHRLLGEKLDLFSIHPLTGQGLILWHPKLAVVRDIVERFWKEEHYKHGYKLVYTPHIASMDMFVKSRHLSKYVNSMFPVMLHDLIEGESAHDYHKEEVLKPMNCPNHIQIYKSRIRSYKELPLRIGELGTVYRYERAGVLHGMTRVRCFTQDDSHIFCTSAQVISEVREVLKLMNFFYKVFGFKDYQAYIATRPEKYLGSLAMWDFAEKSLQKAAKEENFEYKIDKGEGVFYGPKIDLKVKDSIGREWQLGTVQFDFNQPAKAATTKEEIDEFWALKTFKRIFKNKKEAAEYLLKLGRGFDTNYINETGKEEQCVMIHRVILGSLERFFGILIEHFNGAFPTWLAPIQVVLIPITDRNLPYAQKVLEQLRRKNIRAEIDNRKETMQGRIRDKELQKIPYLLILGDQEEKNQQVAVRIFQKGDIGTLNLVKFIDEVSNEIQTRSLVYNLSS